MQCRHLALAAAYIVILSSLALTSNACRASMIANREERRESSDDDDDDGDGAPSRKAGRQAGTWIAVAPTVARGRCDR